MYDIFVMNGIVTGDTCDRKGVLSLSFTRFL